MDWALLVLALVILLQVETYDGKRSCKMDLDKPPHLVCHADPRPCLRESNADMVGAGETVQGTFCVDAHFALDSVPGRSGILIHTGNFASQIRGCILVGLHHDDLNSDGKLDTARSRIALNQLVQLISDPTTITVVSAEGGEVSGV